MIIDCFTFNKEFDLLEARLEYLTDVVDYFVIVEGDITFSGSHRNFEYPTQLARFRKYSSKILYFPFSMDCTGLDFSKKVDRFNPSSAPWQVEKAQRNHFLEALKLFSKDDYVIINDVDEIPSKIGLQVSINNLSEELPKIACKQQMFYYNFNQIQSDPWYGSVITTNGHVRDLTPEGIRAYRERITHVSNGGWHLSNWMSPEEIKQKIESFSHQEYNNDMYTNIDVITQRMKNGEDFLGRSFNKFTKFDVDTLPSDFKDIILKYTKEY